MLQAEILDMALSHVNDILQMINDPKQVKEYEIKRHKLEELLEIEREKQMRVIDKVLEEAGK